MWKLALNCFVLAAALSGAPLALSADTDPCSLLTTDEVSKALGFPVGAGTSLTHGCGWRGTGKQATGKRATIYLQKPDAFATGKMPAVGIEKPSVSGVGDEAYYGYMTDPRFAKMLELTLTVKKGGQVFGVQVWGYAIEDAKQKAKELALAAAAKM